MYGLNIELSLQKYALNTVIGIKKRSFVSFRVDFLSFFKVRNL